MPTYDEPTIQRDSHGFYIAIFVREHIWHDWYFWNDSSERRGWYRFTRSYYPSREAAEASLAEAKYHMVMLVLASIGEERRQ
jgi:hypothetical protein